MGVLLKWALPPTESSWTTIKVERATSSTGTWSEIASQVSSDNSYYDEGGGSNHYYRVRFYNSSTTVYSGYSNIIAGTELSVTYCTPSDVSRLLQVPEFGGDGATKPSLEDVQNFILEAQDEFDCATKHAWRSTTVTDEYHDIDQLNYVPGLGWPIYLQHHTIRALASASGDKLEVFDGSSWVDWLDASNNYTEGRDEDFWVNYTDGILYIRSLNANTSFRKQSVRLTYRYGETTVPREVKKAVSKMVAIDILTSNDRTILVPEGENASITYDSRVRKWQADIDKTISDNAEVLFQYR
ncbi:MAG: hypothetical protein WC307_07235 [Candidatus Nanoarchaeia archaeon]|jgi:hypothetical protein